MKEVVRVQLLSSPSHRLANAWQSLPPRWSRRRRAGPGARTLRRRTGGIRCSRSPRRRTRRSLLDQSRHRGAGVVGDDRASRARSVCLTLAHARQRSQQRAVERLRRVSTSITSPPSAHAAQLLRCSPARPVDPSRQHGDLVAIFRLADVLRGHDQRAAGIAQTAKFGPDRLAQHRIETGRRLVDEQQHRVVDQRARQLQSALHAA